MCDDTIRSVLASPDLHLFDVYFRVGDPQGQTTVKRPSRGDVTFDVKLGTAGGGRAPRPWSGARENSIMATGGN